MYQGGWAVNQAEIPVWDRNYTCRSGVKCIATHTDQFNRVANSDVVLTLNNVPGWASGLNRTRTRLAFLGLEPLPYDIDMETQFDWKALVYAAEDDRHVWTTYSERPGMEFLEAPAQLDWTKKSKDRAVMFMSSNSCPRHRSELVRGLISEGIDVW